jgi:two-component system, chemotaxis family, chemotaxis protein CheY
VSEKQIQLKDLAAVTVMVVDDSAGMRQLLSNVLQSLGIRHVQLAESGPEALSLAKQTKPNLFIVDWEMRPMDGLGLLREIRRVTNRAMAAIPVIVLTAHSSPQVVRAALGNGANQFLTKPVVPQTLLNRMLWALNDRRSFVNRGGFYVHAGQDPSPAPEPAAANVQPPPKPIGPKPTEMWEIE